MTPTISQRFILTVTLTAGVVAMPAHAGAQSSGVTAFIGATLVDGTGAAPIPNSVVLVSGERITAAGLAASVTVPAGATRVDLSGKTLLPGFVNAHGHVPGDSGGTPAEQLTLYARYGVTTVFSLGDDAMESLSLRNAPARGRARLFIAGPPVAGTTAASAAAEVEKNASLKVDWIKVRVDDNLGTRAKIPVEAWSAAVKRAGERGLPVAAHMFYLADAKALLKEGVSLLAHSVRDLPVDAELISLMRQRGACLSPTLMREVSTFVYESRPAFLDDPFFSRYADRKAVADVTTAERQQQTRTSKTAAGYKVALVQANANLKALSAAGVRVAMGTDTGQVGRFQGYFEHQELEMMVKAGLTPMQAIVAATSDAAGCMKKSDLGLIKAGAFADLVVYAANPAVDIKNTRTLESVWVGGHRVP